MQSNKTALMALCAKGGRRMTAQRRIIIDVIAQSHDHPDAQLIHARAIIKDKTISLSTVYRTLKLLSDENLIEQHAFSGRKARVELQPQSHHDHLIDVESGHVIEFRSDEIERLQADMAKRLGYELVGHKLELYGRKLT